MIEIKFIGRGGQGGKTAAYLAAEAAFAAGKQVQAFPEFGPEREGAPVFAFTRISDSSIKIHSGVTNPDIVILIDESLCDELDVMAGVKKGSPVIVNAPKISSKLKRKLKGASIHYVDATKIALAHLGRNIPNLAMLGALATVSDLFSLDSLEKAFKKELGHKLKPEVINKNILAMEEAAKQVKE